MGCDKNTTTTSDQIGTTTEPSSFDNQFQDSVNACPSWKKSSNSVSQPGLYCSSHDGKKVFKCTSTPAGIDQNAMTNVACPTDFKIARVLATDSDDWEKDLEQEMKQLDGEMNGLDGEIDQAMNQMQDKINACKSWEKYASNNISEGGLYCQQDGQNYKCSSESVEGNNISVGNCPKDLKVTRSLAEDGDDDWEKQLDQKMRQMEEKIIACTSWGNYPSGNISEGGLYCQQDGQNYKCSSDDDQSNDISVGDCPATMNIIHTLVI